MRALILRSWAIDPELCPRCQKEMKRARALLQQHELQRLLKNLGIGFYPTRPRSPPPPSLDQDLAQESLFSECPEGVLALGPGRAIGCESQVPAGWDEWEAA